MKMRPQTMKAVRYHHFGGPQVLTVEHVARPEPQEGEILVRIHSAAVLPIDWKIRQRLLPIPVRLPLIPGSSFAGVIEEIGPGVSGYHQGQRVFGRSMRGTYAEYTAVPADALAVIPHSVSFDAAAAIPGGASTAWQALFEDGGLKPGQRILVHGAAGGVGSFAVQFAKWKGAYVSGTSGPHNLDFIRSLGADSVIDYTSARFDQVVPEMDFVLDTVGGDTLARSWSIVKRGGTLVSLVEQPSSEKAAAQGIRAFMPGRSVSNASFGNIAELIDQGAVKASIGESYPLQDAAIAHERSQFGHGRGRIVLHVV